MFEFAKQFKAVGLVSVLAIGLGCSGAAAEDVVNFKGKTITLLVGSEVGGGTDASARLVAPFLTKYLPGQPTVVVQNLPGASGIKALNHFVQRVAPDGLTAINGSISMIDPITYRGANAQYDPKNLRFIGGVGRGGGAIFTSKDAAERLLDKSKKPVIIGSALTVPRSIMQPALWCIEYLGWNATWIVGYHGTNEVMLALDRGEIDMTSTGNLFQIKDRLNSGQLKLINQSGYLANGKIVARQDYGDTPLFPEQMKGKIKDPIAQKAYDYWEALNNGDKWVALPPATPENIVAVYREAFAKASTDPEFREKGEKISDGFEPMTAQDVEMVARTLADTPPAAIDYTKELMRKQGIGVQ
jgi:tripartite-type tricarboxylate transporter receptor subunit TctC